MQAKRLRIQTGPHLCEFVAFAVPWTRCTDSCRAGAGDSNTEREFPPDKVYRRNDRGIVVSRPSACNEAAAATASSNTDVEGLQQALTRLSAEVTHQSLTHRQACPVYRGERLIEDL